MSNYYERLENMSHSDLIAECKRLDHMAYRDGEAYDQLMYDNHFLVKQSHDAYVLLRDVWLYAQQHPEFFTHDLFSKLEKQFNSKEPF